MDRPGRLAARQSAMLALIRHEDSQTVDLAAGWRQAGLRMDPAGCLAYRRNAWAHASRALADAYPTVLAMLGAIAMDTLAARLWRKAPPSGGDLADWGAGLPDLMARTDELADWPWLPDSARLDWACHLCERAQDAEAEPDSLRLLDQMPAERLHLALMPGVRWLCSDWPVAALKDAHAHEDEAARTAAAAQALEEGSSGAVLVWRQGGQARWLNIPDAWAAWTHEVLSDARTSLADHLDRAPAEFDFTAWLTAALSHGWFRRLQALQAA